MTATTSDLALYKSSSGASQGGTATATQCGLAKNDLFPDVSDSERIAGGTRTYKFYLGNDHSTDAFPAPKVWSVSPYGFSPDEIGVGFDDADDDAAAQGNMTAFGGSAVAALVSSGADTRTAHIVGVDSGGTPAEEDVVLNGTSEVLSTTTWSKVYAVKLDSESGSSTVTVKEGTGGTTRGTIGPNVECCWLWVQANLEASAILLPDLPASGRVGIWIRQTWPANVAANRPDTSEFHAKEG